MNAIEMLGRCMKQSQTSHPWEDLSAEQQRELTGAHEPIDPTSTEVLPIVDRGVDGAQDFYIAGGG